MRPAVSLLLFCLGMQLNACVFIPQNREYAGPIPRPIELAEYYRVNQPFHELKNELVEVDRGIEQREIVVNTEHGPAEIDLFDAPGDSEKIVLVFPILGGSYLFERHFAKYFAERGIDAAIVRRNSEFKDPNRLFEVEALLRQGIVRDRTVLDYLERRYGKRTFGSFGISRGGINVALLAGIDARLQHNVIVMGGTDLPALFQHSDQPGIDKYRHRVDERKGVSQEQMIEILRGQIRTDPRRVAKHIDARHTMMILAALDETVPFKYGMRLRRHIGEPETVVMLANHYTSLLFTQFIHLLLPTREFCLFPFDYVESEAMAFYRRAFGMKDSGVKDLILAAAKSPFEMFAAVRCASDRDCRAVYAGRDVRYRRVQSQQFAIRRELTPKSVSTYAQRDTPVSVEQ